MWITRPCLMHQSGELISTCWQWACASGSETVWVRVASWRHLGDRADWGFGRAHSWLFRSFLSAYSNLSTPILALADEIGGSPDHFCRKFVGLRSGPWKPSDCKERSSKAAMAPLNLNRSFATVQFLFVGFLHWRRWYSLWQRQKTLFRDFLHHSWPCHLSHS